MDKIYYGVLICSGVFCVGYAIYLITKKKRQNSIVNNRMSEKNRVIIWSGYHKENSPILEEPYHQVVTEGEELLNTEDSGSFILDDSIIQGGEYFVC